MGDKDILVDVCCGPCSIPLGDIYKELRERSDIELEDLKITFYITDDNVHPYSEYERRLDSIKIVAKNYFFDIKIDDYKPQEWFDLVRGLEDEKENGERCELCYKHRLVRAAKYATANGYKNFTTTLTTGPSKEAKTVNRLGKEIAQRYGLNFIEHDLKKKGGFLKSVVLSKQLGLYRQNYCGCIYSMMEKGREEHNKVENSSSDDVLVSKKMIIQNIHHPRKIIAARKI